ncbi:MAG: XdhC family protein [Rhodobacteraceae bacterium]|nr:MAG: XdhC family protein [Paracoccaceae bacterium]
MTRDEVFDAIRRLREEERPFAVATVIRTEDATSARPGDKAVITEDGAILGHLGGGCVMAAARRAAANVRESGAPQVIRVRPADKVVSLTDADGAAVHRSGCPSGGSVEMLIEPFAPSPRLCVWGDGATAAALARIGGVLRLRVVRDPEGSVALAQTDFAVVATQGHGDLAALRAALDSGAGFVGMIASRRKAAALVRKAAEAGAPADRLAALRSPVGLAIGAADPEEIAVAVAAEIVAARRGVVRPSAVGDPLQAGEVT